MTTYLPDFPVLKQIIEQFKLPLSAFICLRDKEDLRLFIDRNFGDTEPNVITYDVKLKNPDTFLNNSVNKYYNKFIEIGIDLNGNVLYGICKSAISYIYVVLPKFDSGFYDPDIEAIIISRVLEYFKDNIIIHSLKENIIKVDITFNYIPFNEIVRSYNRLFLEQAKKIINIYKDQINTVYRHAFNNAIRLLKKHNIVKIKDNYIVVKTSIVPIYAVIKDKIYRLKDSVREKYTYKNVLIKLLISNVEVIDAYIVSSGKVIHPQIDVINKHVCLGDLRGREIYYVVENLREMLSVWNIDNGYRDTLNTIKSKLKINSFYELIERNKNKSKTECEFWRNVW